MIRWQLLSVLLFAGCGLTIGGYEPIVENRCTHDSDCPGASCDAALGMCVSRDTPLLQVGFEITPATSVGGMPTTFSFPPIEIDGPDERHFELDPPINVIGNVRGPGGEAVQADVHFTRPGAFAGARSIVVETTTVATPVVAADDLPADYAVRVAAERVYSVLIEPTGEWASRLPPLRLEREVPGGGDFVRINFNYPADMPELHGVIVGSGEEPVDGLIVKAVEAVSGRVLSSTAVTGTGVGDAGEFTILLDPLAESYVIRITGGETRADFPTLLADPSYFYPEPTGLVRILVPVLETITYAGSVVYLDTEEAAPGAVLSFRATEIIDDTTGFTGTFRTTVTADDRGEYSATLIPGLYEVVVTPPADRDRGNYGVALTTELPLQSPANGQRYELPSRAHLGGTVRTPDERVMSGAMVNATALGVVPEGGDPVARHNRTSDSTTDPLGQFNLPLDVGVYDVYVRPPAGSRFPWVVSPAYMIGAATNTYTDVFEVTAPVPLIGTIHSVPPAAPGVEVMPVVEANAEIRAYAIIGDGESQRAVHIGTATSGDDGSFMLLLPARLSQ
jgi:hypothetical protein